MRRSPLRKVSAKRAAEAPGNAAVRAAVFRRDGGCVLERIHGAGPCYGKLTVHHKLKASQGGKYTEANLVAMCASHNDRLESDAALSSLAETMGLVIRRRSMRPVAPPPSPVARGVVPRPPMPAVPDVRVQPHWVPDHVVMELADVDPCPAQSCRHRQCDAARLAAEVLAYRIATGRFTVGGR